jgi:hypothetical protein
MLRRLKTVGLLGGGTTLITLAAQHVLFGDTNPYFALTRFDWAAKKHIMNRMTAPMDWLELNPKSTRVENSALQKSIEYALLNRLCALQVLYAPHNAGKTYATMKAVRRLRDEGKIGGTFLKQVLFVHTDMFFLQVHSSLKMPVL